MITVSWRQATLAKVRRLCQGRYVLLLRGYATAVDGMLRLWKHFCMPLCQTIPGPQKS
jgi:hypothetical protein